MSLIGTIRDAVSGLTASVEARKQTPTGNALNVQIGPGDIISNIPVMQPYDHHQVHEGESWHYDFYVASLGSGVSKDIRIVVPNITITTNAVTQCPHLRYEVTTSDMVSVLLYEGATFSANGTQRTPVNLERNGTYTALMQIWEDPTVSTTGAQIDRSEIFTAAGGASNGGVATDINEFVLKNNTSYLFRVTSGAAGNKVLIDIHWYEDLGV